MSVQTLESNREALLKLAYTLAPELHERPLYIVTAPELGITPGPGGCAGLVGLATDLGCRDAIGERWRGRGWCIVLHSAEESEGVLLHEIAHLVDGGLVWTDLRGVSPQTVAAVIRDDLHRDLVKFSKPIPKAWHGAQFQRALIHLRYRALQAGVCLGWHELGAQSRCPMHLLAAALGDEPARYFNEPFTQIMARPMPRRFRKLWNRRHVMSAERQERMSLSALVRGLKGRKQAAVESYSQAVVRVADEGTVALETLEQLLAAAGKSPESFQADVERLRRRREAARQIHEAADCEQRRKAADRRVKVVQAALDRVQAAFDQAAAEADAELAQIRIIEQRASDARRLLADTADAGVKDQVRQAENAVAQASHELTAANAELDRLTHVIESAEQQLADVQAGRVELVGTRRYIGPAISESECRKRLDQTRSARQLAQQRLEAARKAMEKTQHQADQAREVLLVP